MVSATGGVTLYGYDGSNRASDDHRRRRRHQLHDLRRAQQRDLGDHLRGDQQLPDLVRVVLREPVQPARPAQRQGHRLAQRAVLVAERPTYDTQTAYNANGQVTTVTTPATAACPAGCATTHAYTKGTETAVGGGTEPAGLLASVTTPGGGVTTYAYDSSGDLMQTANPLGLVTKYTYDNIGRELTSTQISNTYPAGLTTSFTYDGQDRLVTQTDPPVTDRVTGAVHTRSPRYTYDADSDVLTSTVSDSTGGDPSRTTTSTYNSHGQAATMTDPMGNVTSYTYDPMGNLATTTDPSGVVTAYAYDADGEPADDDGRRVHR